MNLIGCIGLLSLLTVLACEQDARSRQSGKTGKRFFKTRGSAATLRPDGKTLETRILPPAGYQRVAASEISFAAHLRQLPLKPHGSRVTYFNGRLKPNLGIYEAVVDLPIGSEDLHQCADALMRLWAEYLWNKREYHKIHFNFTNGFRVDYTEWMNGKRIVVKGNKSYWVKQAPPSNSYEDFWDYLEIIFMYAGTLSLSRELNPASIADMQIGDIFIQGGSPGHAVMVADMAQNPKSGAMLFLLVQSYMPAQEIQILKNPLDKKISPWYSTAFGDTLETPEWVFHKSDLKRFQ